MKKQPCSDCRKQYPIEFEGCSRIPCPNRKSPTAAPPGDDNGFKTPMSPGKSAWEPVYGGSYRREPTSKE